MAKVAFKTKIVDKYNGCVQVFYKGSYIYTGFETKIIKQNEECALVKNGFDDLYILMCDGREVYNPHDKYGISEFDRLIKKLYQ